MLRFLIAALTTAHGLRLLGGLRRTAATMAGELHPLHYLPGIGDAVAGAAALILVLLIAVRGLTPSVRTSALVWNLYGALDLIVAIPVNVLERPSDPQFYTPVLALGFLALHVILFVMLCKVHRWSPTAPNG